jgi:hypothetical protein
MPSALRVVPPRPPIERAEGQPGPVAPELHRVGEALEDLGLLVEPVVTLAALARLEHRFARGDGRAKQAGVGEDRLHDRERQLRMIGHASTTRASSMRFRESGPVLRGRAGMQTDITKSFIQDQREALGEAKAKGSKHVRVDVRHLQILIDLADPTAAKLDQSLGLLIERVLEMAVDAGGIAEFLSGKGGE